MVTKIKILINALHTKSGGAVTYMENILPILCADKRLSVVVYLHESQRGLAEQRFNGAELHFCSFKSGFFRTLLHEQTGLVKFARAWGAEVVFSPANYGPLYWSRHVILLRNALSVGLHDPRLSKKLYWSSLLIMTIFCALRARRVIAVSDYAARQITSPIKKLINHKLTIVGHGVSDKFLHAVPPKTLPAPFLLLVSDIYVQKNIHGLIDALHLIAKDDQEITLKIAGAFIDLQYKSELEAQIKRLGLEDNVAFLGRKSPDELVDLYTSCTVFVFPSVVETFGNPLVEAMAAGAPIACSNSAAMPEIAADGVDYFDPTDSIEIYNVIHRLLTSGERRQKLSQRARTRGAQYSWPRTAEKTIEQLIAAAQPSKNH